MIIPNVKGKSPNECQKKNALQWVTSVDSCPLKEN